MFEWIYVSVFSLISYIRWHVLLLNSSTVKWTISRWILWSVWICHGRKDQRGFVLKHKYIFQPTCRTAVCVVCYFGCFYLISNLVFFKQSEKYSTCVYKSTTQEFFQYVYMYNVYALYVHAVSYNCFLVIQESVTASTFNTNEGNNTLTKTDLWFSCQNKASENKPATYYGFLCICSI